METALLNYITAENAKREAWIAEDPSNRWVGLYPTDPKYWEMSGISTLAQLQRQELIDGIYEVTKDTWGYRRDVTYLEGLSMDELQREADRTFDQAKRENDREKERQAQNFADFKTRVQETMEIVVNCDQERAVQLIAAAEDITPEEINFYGWEALEFRLDVPYGSIKKMMETNQ